MVLLQTEKSGHPKGVKIVTKVAEVNRLFYDSAGVAEIFGPQIKLCPAEELILESYKDEIKDRSLLEIGVGAGRITPHLTALTKDYIGIDCSTRMLDVARQKFPSARFLVCAAEEMTMFEDHRFATVVFFGNGIDEVEHEQRILIFKEINRVLKKGGLLLLSSHNLDWGRLMKSAAFDSFSFKRDPVHAVISLPRRLWILLHCEVLRLLARLSKRGYAIFPLYGDYGNGVYVTTPSYHISNGAQTRQLMSAGFEQVRVFTSRGASLNDPAAQVDHKGHFDFELYYVSHKS